MFHRLMRCNVYNYASTCMFPFRKNRFSMPRSHYFFLKNYLCYLIIALVCNIFGLGERTFSQWNVFHDPGWPGSSCVQGNSLYTCLYRCDLSFYIHYIISFETVRLNCKGILIHTFIVSFHFKHVPLFTGIISSVCIVKLCRSGSPPPPWKKKRFYS